MTKATTAKEYKHRVKWRREAPYPRKLSVCVPAEFGERLDQEAERERIGVSVIARRAMMRGLPMLQDARRKSGRKKSGPAPAKTSKRPRRAKA